MIMQRLTKPESITAAQRDISLLFRDHPEWFHTTSDGNAVALRRDELDVAIAHGKLILTSWTEKGTRSWTIRAWQWSGEKLLLEASRRMGAETPIIELVPRAAASAIAATIKAARLKRCHQLSQLAAEQLPGAKIERAMLSPGVRRGQPGRYGRVVLWTRHERVALTASVASHRASDVDSYLSSALLWFQRLNERAKPPYFQQLWLVLEGELTKAVLPRLPLLREGLQSIISAFEIDRDWTELRPLTVPQRSDLWRRRLPRFPPVADSSISDAALTIRAIAPQAIDIVRARHGETLRYFGMPFARVRRLIGQERVWFGAEADARRLLEERSRLEWDGLLNDLRLHRSPNAPDRRHSFYRNAAEAWLESLLRRDITKLDPGLIIAPLHAQFRTAPGGQLGVRPIDLLALRQDGRLVVIELKVFEDREHVFQSVGYWQRVEAHRRRGHIAKAKLFGDRKISDEAPLVYLVAPWLRVHPSLTSLARFVAPDIELYRFDLSEDWRHGVRVIRRQRVN